MKPDKETSLRWLEQAEHNIKVSKSNLKEGFFSDACFMAEQAAQIALKAFIIAQRRRFPREHSVQELATMSSKYDKDFENVVEAGKILDRYYIPTRYPDALAPPAIPFKSFVRKDALDAIELAEKILDLARRKLGIG